jgi:hypothetical protein
VVDRRAPAEREDIGTSHAPVRAGHQVGQDSPRTQVHDVLAGHSEELPGLPCAPMTSSSSTTSGG